MVGQLVERITSAVFGVASISIESTSQSISMSVCLSHLFLLKQATQIFCGTLC